MAKTQKLIFRLIIEGKTPSTWELPQSNVMGVKEGKGKKFINYYPGEDSCFVEDIEAKNKDLRPARVPLFKFNSQTRQTELSVDTQNVALVNYLKTHPWFGVKFNVFSKQEDAKIKLKEFEDTEKALELIKKSDVFEIKACAMTVFGLASFYKTTEECSAELKANAIKSPSKILEAFNMPDFDNRFTAGLALASGIIKINPTHTAIVWADNDGLIAHIAQGENGLDKFTKFLSQDNEQSQIMLQELNDRLERKNITNVDTSKLVNELSEKDAEIERLKKQLEEATKNATNKAETSGSEKTIEELQNEFKLKFDKEPAVTYKNNKEWLEKKLAE